MALLRAVAEHALHEAEECEAQATKLESAAAALRHEATGLRDLHAIAERHVRPAGRVDHEIREGVA